MKRIRRLVAVLLTVLLLETAISNLFLPAAFAAPGAYQDPLGLLPDWALAGGIPQDPVADLRPRNPLEGLLPAVPTPQAPGLPRGSNQGTGQPSFKAPADVNVPSPPPGPDCDCTPDHVNVGTGALSLSATDLTLNGVGEPIQLVRRYNSENADKDGPFGPGWSLNLDSRLEMYLHWNITEYRGDGTFTTFNFQDGSGGSYVDSFDGDNLIHLDLAKGSYSPESAPGYELERRDAETYVVTRPDGLTATYFGYRAGWRQGQDPRAGRLLKLSDRNGNVLDFTYDTDGQLTRVADAYGRFLSLGWATGHIVSATDQAGRTFTYTYTEGHLTGVSAKDSPALSYGYETAAPYLLNRQAGGPARAVTYEYDSDGRVTRAGNASYQYESGQTIYTDGAGNDWVYELDGKQRVIRLVDPLGHETITAYDDQGRKQSVKAPDGIVTAYSYDDAGRVLSETSSAQVVTYTYGDFGLVTSTTTAAGTTVTRYDSRGNLLSRAEPGKPGVEYTYDAAGRKLTETVAGLWKTEYRYADSQAPAMPSVVINPLQQSEARAYNALGLLTAVTDAQGFTSKFGYDAAGRLVREENPAGGVTTYRYNAFGQLEAVTRPSGMVLAYAYAPASGLVTQLSVTDGPTYAYTYDGAGRVLTAAIDAGHFAAWTWDKAGQLQKVTDLRNTETAYTYDPAGRILSVSGAKGTVTYDRDPATGRVTAIHGPGTREVSFGYDQAGRINRVTGGGATVSAVLDGRGSPLTVTDRYGQTTQYEYDPRGMVTRVTYPDGRVATARYDALGRPAETAAPSGDDHDLRTGQLGHSQGQPEPHQQEPDRVAG